MTKPYTTCRFDHHGLCQEHNLRPSTGVDLKCIDGINESLNAHGQLLVHDFILQTYMQGHRT